MMSRVQKGMVAGAAATVIVSLMEAINVLFLQWFAPFPLIVSNILGLGRNMPAGWAIHVAVGVLVLGPLFGILCPKLPTDTPETKGILFSVVAFVALMVVMMVVGDNGVFGTNFGTIGWLLVTNAVFGIVMGNVYARLVARDKHAPSVAGGAAAS